MANARFIIRVTSHNLRAEVRVNDIPVVMILPEEATEPVSVPVNEFVIAGRNVVSVLLHAGPTPTSAAAPWTAHAQAAWYSGPSSLELRVAQYREDQNVTRDTPPPIVSLNWEGVATPRPLTLQREFSIDAAFGLWAWQTAASLGRLDAESRGAAFQFLSYLHNLLARTQITEFVEQNDLKIEEITARAYGVASSPMRATLARALQTHVDDRTWKLHPLNPEEVELRLVAGDRMVECLGKNWQHALVYTQGDSENTFFLPAMIGLMGSSWRLLR